jgi:hypothetical protein
MTKLAHTFAFSGAMMLLCGEAYAAPEPIDMLYGCVQDPDMLNSFCSENFLSTMTTDLQAAHYIAANEKLAKGTLDGKATIVVAAPDGRVRPVPSVPHTVSP